ncbi:LysR family transcriptional regulator [Photobacterium jeanii]|uniref:LysR family transcriptional regulator n=1 Tax=Photobacterium jeanii TaxID=858640 RepID=A0A178K4M6_9GAMM|nr:LysR family transcriptional regulator [Photobacterium jeanii]OAN11672.1 LysR family transcriptional regulator [Photobacterium jeanii]PST91206.1 LysR family transcriptional regulator [Photobacterium jeanii]
MLDKIEQKWLQSFHAVFELNSFKNAAEQLELPTSNISRHITLLEQALNVRLFERTTRRVNATEAGKQLYSSTHSIFTNLNDALEDIAKHTHTMSGRLRLIMPDIAPLSSALVSFSCRYPDINIGCETSLNPQEDLLDGFDLIISFNRGKLTDCGWVAKEIHRLESVVVGSPALISKVGKPYLLTELIQMPCISSLTALNASPWVFQTGKHQFIKQSVNASFKVNSGQTARTAAIAGLGFAILPKESCRQELEAGTLSIVDMEATPADLVLYAMYSGLKHTPHRVSVFLQHLQEVLSQH